MADDPRLQASTTRDAPTRRGPVVDTPRRSAIITARRARRIPYLPPGDQPLPQRVQDWVRHVAAGMTDEQAAAEAGIRLKRARGLLLDPRVRSLLAVQMEVLRVRERPRNLQALIGIRDDERLVGSAAGAKARIDAVRVLERMAEEDESSTHAGARGGGYRVDLSEEPAEGVRVTVDYVRIGGYASNVSDRVPSAARNAGMVIDGEAIEAPADAVGEGRPGGSERG